MNSFSYLGRWWVHGEKDKHVDGVLSFSPGAGLRLELTGSLPQPDWDTSKGINPEPPNVILGEFIHDAESPRITLENYQQASIISNVAFIAEQYRPLRAYVGAHFSSLDNLQFYKAEINYDYLADWFGKGELQLSPVSEGKVSRYNLAYKEEEDIEAQLDDAKIIMQRSSHLMSRWREEASVTLTEKFRAIVQTDGEMLFSDLMFKFINPIRDLITFGTYKPVRLVDILVFSNRMIVYPSNMDWQESEDPPSPAVLPSPETIEAAKNSPIQVFFDQPTDNSSYTPLNKLQQLFVLDDLDDFEVAIKAWIDIERRGRDEADIDIHQLLLSGIYSPTMSPDQSFNSLTRAVEAYYKIDTSAGEGAKLWNALRWLVEVGEQLTNLFPDPNSKECFIQRVGNTRNRQTHAVVSSTGPLITSQTELAIVNNILLFLLQSYLMQRLVIKGSRRAAIVTQNIHYKFISIWASKFAGGCVPDTVKTKHLTNYLRSTFPASTN